MARPFVHLPRVNAFVVHEVVRPGLVKGHVIRLLRDERPCGGGHEEWWLGAHRCPWCKAAI